MALKKLNARIARSWSTYAASVFGVITDCGMWDLYNDWYGSFLNLTGISFQTIFDKTCSPASVTSYDWEKEHNGFLNRIGITTNICCSFDGEVHNTVLSEIKQSIDSCRGVILWGVDTGEFGVIYGYDDDDGVLFVSGIGGNDSKESNPILFQNLGNTFGKVLYCQFLANYEIYPIDTRIKYSLAYYVDHMTSDNANHGLKAYNNLLYALDHECNDFGLRYTAGVYTERKQHASSFFNDEVQKLYNKKVEAKKAAEIYNQISKLFDVIHFELLNQDFNGWNHLNKSVDSKVKKEIVPIVKEIAIKEKEVINLIKMIL